MSLETLLKPPFPNRDAAGALSMQVKDYIRTRKPAVGSPLATDTELMKFSQLSRSTVRRALNQLKNEGWVLRRRGVGTFVGEKAGELHATPSTSPVRLAVLVFRIGDLAHDWYTPLVLEGLEVVAERLGLAVELLGQNDRDLDRVCKRLEQTRPNVLACLCNDPWVEVVIRAAQRLGIHCLVAGTPHAHLGVPAVMEDNRQAIELAVDYLWTRGHRRMALLLPRYPEPWVMERHESFINSLWHRGLDDAEALVHWLPMQMPAEDAPVLDRLYGFLKRLSVTAVIPGDAHTMRCMDTLVRSGRVSVPDTLSVVGMEQDQGRRRWMGTADADRLHMPMEQIGQKLGEYAHALSRGATVPMKTVLAATMISGNTVARLPTSEQ